MSIAIRANGSRCERLMVALVVVAVSSMGCGQPPSPAEPAPSGAPPWTSGAGDPTSTSGVSASADSPKQAVLAAYTGMWSAVAVARENPDGAHDVARYATGPALAAVSQLLAADAQLGRRTTGRPGLTPLVLVLMPPARPVKARVRDCCDTTRWITYQSSGQRAPGEVYGRRQVDAVVKVADGRWRVTEFVMNGVGTC